MSLSITNVDEEKLIDLITSAHHRLTFIAPGVSDEVGAALAQKWKELGADSMQVIVDVDPEVCRLGYGTIGGLKHLRSQIRELGGLIAQQPGIRIGVVISDRRTIIFSPTPLLIEAGSDVPERPNAIELADAPAALLQDTGLGPDGVLAKTVGLDPVRPEQIDDVESDLKRQPPLKFDLARQVRVFTSQFQFVELKMTGCLVSRKRIRIPTNLIGMAGNKDLERQFHAHYDLVQARQFEVESDGEQVVTEKALSEARAQLKRDFIIDLAGYGSVILRSNKEAFDTRVKELEASIKAFSNGVGKQLQTHMNSSRAALEEALLPAVLKKPPSEYSKLLGPSPTADALRTRLSADLEAAFGSSEALLEKMSVSVVYKDVSYESLTDTNFLDTARKAMPEVKWLHREFQASPEHSS